MRVLCVHIPEEDTEVIYMCGAPLGRQMHTGLLMHPFATFEELLSGFVVALTFIFLRW